MAEINPTAINPANRNALTQPAAAEQTSEIATDFWGEDGFTFGDILDFLNPLQHIPIIGTIYRAVTGDDISIGSRIVGGGLFGGVIGFGAAVVSAIIEETTGRDMDEHIIAMFDGEATPPEDGAPAPAVLASAETRYGFDRRDQEASRSEWTVLEPTPATTTVAAKTTAAAATTTAALASAPMRDYAFNPLFVRGAQEATMTSPAFLIESPPAPDDKPAMLAALPVERPAIQASAAAPAQGSQDAEIPASMALREAAWLSALPRSLNSFAATAIQASAAAPAQGSREAEIPASMAPREAVWLSALPRSQNSFAATAIRYVTPATGLQLAQAIAGNAELQLASGLNALTRFAIDRYNQQALAAKIMQTGPGAVDTLF